MNDIYRCESIIAEIERIAATNETGEITEEQLQALVEAQTASMVQLEKLCNYLSWLDSYINTGQGEIERIHKLVSGAKKRQESIKRYITPYVDAQREKLGRPLDVGTHRLSTRHSESIVITDPESFSVGAFPNESRTKTIHEPDKGKIKAYIEEHGSHPGAVVQKNISLTIK
jgi:hypothetical protein